MKKLIAALLIGLMLIGLVGCNSPTNITAGAVIESIKSAGLPIVYYIEYDEKTDPNGSSDHDYMSKANFADANQGNFYSEAEPKSGSVEVFSSKSAAKKRADYLSEWSKLNDFEYQIIKDNILLRLDTYFSLDYVQQYADALEGEIYSKPSKTYKSTVQTDNFIQPDVEQFVDRFNQCGFYIKISTDDFSVIDDYGTYLFNPNQVSPGLMLSINDQGLVDQAYIFSLNSDKDEAEYHWLKCYMCGLDNTLLESECYGLIDDIRLLGLEYEDSEKQIGGLTYKIRNSDNSLSIEVIFN